MSAQENQPGSEALPALTINTQYIKDLSLEVPNAPAIFRENASAEIPVAIDVRARHLEANSFEVELHIKVESKLGDRIAFVLELVYGAMVTLNVPQEHVQPVLLVEVPRLLFPFVRNIVCDMTRDGGFSPLMLAPIDFLAMYTERLRQAQAQQQQQQQNQAPQA